MKKYKSLIIFFILGLVIFLFVGEKGYTLSLDSSSYINMEGFVPPLYPIFLQIMRKIFGEVLYLEVVVIVQGILASSSIALLIFYLRKEFKVGYIVETLFFVALLLIYCRGDSPSFSIGTRAILTEGLSYSLFYLFILFSLIFWFSQEFKNYKFMILLTILLTLTREQFFVCFAIDFVVLVLYTFQHKENKIKFIRGMLVLIIGYLIVIGAQNTYKFLKTGTIRSEWHSLSSLTHLMYCSKEEDSERFYYSVEREIFEKLYKRMDEIKYLSIYADKEFYKRGEYYSENFVNARNELQIILENEKLDDISVVLDGLKNELSGYTLNWGMESLYQTPKSIGNSIFFVRPPYEKLCIMIASLLYIGAFVVLGIDFYFNRFTKAVWFMLFVLGFTIINIFSTQMMIRTIARYLTYSMGIFYIAGLLLLIDLYKTILGSRIKNEQNKIGN